MEGSELTSVPMYSALSEDWRQGEGAVAAFRVLQGNVTTADNYVPFNWQILSELH